MTLHGLEPFCTQGDVLAHGIRIHYYRTGGDKPPLILSHGITDSGLCFTRVVPALAPDYDVITWDARGHGLSEIPRAHHSASDQADDLEGLVRALQLEAPILMGHSMGAATTAGAAARYPGLARAVVLEDPPWRDPVGPRPSGASPFADGVRAYRDLGYEGLMAYGAERSPLWAPEVFPAWAEAKFNVSIEMLESRMPSRAPWRETAAAITCPALLVIADPNAERVAGQAGITTPEGGAEAVALMAKGKLASIKGVGHNIRREGFEAFMAAVHSFLASL